LGEVYGGTGQSTYTTGDLLYSSASNTLAKLAIGTANYILTVNSGGTNVQWSAPSSISVSTATNLAGGVAGSVPYQSGASTTTFLGIGAADRVMTSSGSAPQWVTSLTSLTGVSSSSITNTSLTSGRVVYSGTGGLQTNSANLTFDGTTLTTAGLSNSGTSALVKLVTVGGSSFNGTTVFAAATPAKLYMGTGTVTDTTSAIGATNAVGAVASLAITPIAASNTGVTYTNASTLYIAGAPSAGTNISITNPYALYVNAGASVFDGTVGIGVAPPVAKLDVAKTSNDTITRANAVGSFGDFLSLGAGLLMQQTLSSPYGFVLQASNAANSAQFPLVLNPSGGNVGIGTSSPATKLDVNGNARVNELLLSNGAVPSPSLGTTPSWYSPASGVAALSTNAAERMRIDSSGNLGIGTTSPSDTIGYGRALDIQSTTGAAIYLRDSDNPTTQYGAIAFDGNASVNNLNIINSTSTGPIRLFTNGNERARIDSSGNVGIGTTSPAGKLEVNGLTFVNNTGSSTGRFLIRNSTTGTSAGGLDIQQVGVDASINNSSNGYMSFSTNNTERARIDSSGNVGIGATSPTAKLQVNSGTNLGGVLIGFNGTSANFYDADAQYWRTGNGTGRMTLDSSGNLLVGATSSSGLVSNNAKIVGGNFSTVNGNGSITSSATTVITLATQDGATYLFSCQNISDSGTPSSYGATSIISQEGSALAATAIQTGTFTTIGVSGLNIQITSSLGSKVYKWSLVRIL
jgi:hypothetical protein